MDQNTKNFYQLLANTTLSTVTNMTIWFAIVFYGYLQTRSVLVTGVISGLYLLTTAFTGFWLGGIVDHYNKKKLMIISSFISLILYIVCFGIYTLSNPSAFTDPASPILWVFIVLILAGVLTSNIRGIIMPILVTILVPADKRDKANGLVGTVFGVSFLIVSVISGLLVGHSGMYLVLILGIVVMILTIIHLLLIPIPEVKQESLEESQTSGALAKLDIKGTIKIIKSIPGLLTLIFYTTINNFLGGVFMSLLDAYGLSLVSVQVWGILFGVISTSFIFGGMFIAKFGLGKNPLRALFLANVTIWIVASLFTIQPWIVLLVAGMFIYLSMIPFIEAAENTLIQKVVDPTRQGRVFGIAHSIEQAASPLTAFFIGPIAQFIFIPFMSQGGAGANLIGPWFGVGADRGIALLFTITGIIGLIITLFAMSRPFYKKLSAAYLENKNELAK